MTNCDTERLNNTNLKKSRYAPNITQSVTFYNTIHKAGKWGTKQQIHIRKQYCVVFSVVFSLIYLCFEPQGHSRYMQIYAHMRKSNEKVIRKAVSVNTCMQLNMNTWPHGQSRRGNKETDKLLSIQTIVQSLLGL